MSIEDVLKQALFVIHNQGDVGVDELIAVEKALRQAIAEAEKQSDMPKIGCVNHDCDKCKAEKPYNATSDARLMEMPKQEPVAWGVDWGENGDQSCVSIVKRLANGCIEVVAIEYSPTPSPPQRQWVGLTDEDVMSIAFNFDLSSLSLVAKAIEAKLKEKNNG